MWMRRLFCAFVVRMAKISHIWQKWVFLWRGSMVWNPSSAQVQPLKRVSDKALGMKFFSSSIYYEPRHEKTCFSHMRTTTVQISLRIYIVWSDSTFAVRYLDSIRPILAKSKISRLQLVTVAEQAGLSPQRQVFAKRGSFVSEQRWL